MSRRGCVASVAAVLLGAATVATAPTPVAAALPSAAVSIGDSFISGEGAGSYSPVADNEGVAHQFPGWSAPNSHPYFCHRSASRCP